MTDTPYKTILDHLADLRTYVGKELGLSDWIEITQDKINAFAKLTEDEQWIHVDVEKSKKHSPYRQTVAHGFMILSYASRICYDTVSIADLAMGVNYGLDKVRNPSATLSGAHIRGRVSLMEFLEIEGGARYKLNIVFEIKGQEKPACVAEFIAQAYVQ